VDLDAAWLALCRRVGARGEVAGTGARLLAAYGAPDRAYHDLRHLSEVLARIDELAGAAPADNVRLAAWFHDAVYESPTATPAEADRPPASSEHRSAELAVELLGELGVAATTIAEVARLVRLTETHRAADGDVAGAVLCDADLAVLARDTAGYAQYARDIRREYASLPDEVFRHGRAAVLRDLLDQPRLFRTDLATARSPRRRMRPPRRRSWPRPSRAPPATRRAAASATVCAPSRVSSASRVRRTSTSSRCRASSWVAACTISAARYGASGCTGRPARDPRR
jgi:predicted metal-dependent HD superfamily phosphohydrolase